MANTENLGFKPYEELGIMDDFMFGKVMGDLKLCRDVLECLLQRKVGKLEDSDLQKEFLFTFDGKPIRMDVFTRSVDEVFDVEAQNLNKKSVKSLELPKRTRFYQSSIDADYMRKKYSYKLLPESSVLFLCTFDPFGKGKGMYTFREKCEEDADLHLGDGTAKIFFNCTYIGEDIPKDLKRLYEYINTGKAGDALTKRIDEAVVKARNIEEWRSEYVKEMVLLMDAREEGLEKGRKEEQKNTEKERRRADTESRRADKAEARVRELEAMLAAVSGNAS